MSENVGDVLHQHTREIDRLKKRINKTISNAGDVRAPAAPGHLALTLAADADTLLGLTAQQLTLDAQAANLMFAGPTAGGAADPSFRALVSADLPATVVETGDAAWVDLTDGGATTLHSHAGGAGSLATDALWAALGDLVYAAANDTAVILSGNITTTRKFLRQTGNGSISAAPAWDTIADADVPASHSGSAHHAALTIGADAEHSLAAQVLSGVDATTTQKGHAKFDATNPAALGVAAPGASGVIADRAHVHLDPVTAHVAAGDPHTAYALDTDLSTHAGAPDPHAGYVLESLIDADGDLIVGSAADTVVRLPKGAADGYKLETRTGTPDLGWAKDYVPLLFIIDGGGATITTGVKGDIYLLENLTVEGWTLLADQSGSIVLDIWQDTYANYPPTIADTITASDKPTISTATKGQDLAPTGWDTTLDAGSSLRINVDSITTCQRVSLTLHCIRR